MEERRIKAICIKDGKEETIELIEREGKDIWIKKNGKTDNIWKGILTLVLLRLKLDCLNNIWLIPVEKNFAGYILAIRDYYDKVTIIEGDAGYEEDEEEEYVY